MVESWAGTTMHSYVPGSITLTERDNVITLRHSKRPVLVPLPCVSLSSFKKAEREKQALDKYDMIPFLLNIHTNIHMHTKKKNPEECKSSVYNHYLWIVVLGVMVVNFFLAL